MRADMTEAIMPQTLQPLRAMRALRVVARDTENSAAGAEMVGSLTGRSWLRLFARFAADPMGARILRERRRLEQQLVDRDVLAALPKGSLGRTYFEWTEAENLSAEGLIEAASLAVPRADRLTEDQRAFLAREQVAHDLWHVVTGYGRDLLGEAALLHMMWIQHRNTGILLPTALSTLVFGVRTEGRRVIREARVRARRGSWLPAADWETLLTLALDEVRERLSLGEPTPYTPVYRENI